MEDPRIYAMGFHNPAGGAQTAHRSPVRSLDGGQTWRTVVTIHQPTGPAFLGYEDVRVGP